MRTENKIKQLKQLDRIVAKAKQSGQKIVFTNGCFDILHLGHIKFLEQACSLGDKLIVAVNSDSSARKIKGKKRPVMSQKARAALLAALSCVDYVTVFSQPTPLKLIKLLKPDVLVKGSDWRTQDIVGSKFVQSYGGKVARVALIKGYSTSAIISQINKTDEKKMAKNNRC